MYIALKWLVGLALAMWLAMCFTELVIKQNRRSLKEGIFNSPVTQFQNKSRTTTKQLPSKTLLTKKQQNTEALHLLMFIAGAIAVSVFHRKNEIYTFAKQKMKFDVTQFNQLQKKFQIAAVMLGVAIVKLSERLWEKIKNAYDTYNTILEKLRFIKHDEIISNLIDKLNQAEEERKHVNQLLISAIHENKNIRMRFELEVMAKNRLIMHVENVQKQIKEHRSRYVSFQQLYLVTHQENIFLKSRIRKLIQDKDDAEKNLMKLVNEIYKSANNELKAYCKRTVTKSKDDKITSDVDAVVEKFLEKSRKSLARSVDPDIHRHSSSPRINDIIQDSLVRAKSVPKLKGLPGEYVWTVKDKNGIIEKLYEYDSDSDYDNGETIRRIRQYSVYFDKDCLLDFTKSLPQTESEPSTSGYHVNSRVYPITSKRIVTGSEAFQNFLRNNKSLVPTKETCMVLQN